jgi:hypothetical protein
MVQMQSIRTEKLSNKCWGSPKTMMRCLAPSPYWQSTNTNDTLSQIAPLPLTEF